MYLQFILSVSNFYSGRICQNIICLQLILTLSNFYPGRIKCEWRIFCHEQIILFFARKCHSFLSVFPSLLSGTIHIAFCSFRVYFLITDISKCKPAVLQCYLYINEIHFRTKCLKLERERSHVINLSSLCSSSKLCDFLYHHQLSF